MMRVTYFVILACITLVAFPVYGEDCPTGDIGGDCKVGIEDLVAMAGQWLDPAGCGGHADDCADIYYSSTPDGVDGHDFAILAGDWGTIVPTGTLTVTISPQDAIDAGGQWSIDGDVWHDSGDEILLVLDIYMVQFSSLLDLGWQNLAPVEVEIFADTLATVDRTYLPIQNISLQINEFMASNGITFSDPEGQFDDWFEIYNSTDSPVEMGGMWVADKGNMWQIIDSPPATTIPAGGYLLFWADNDTLDGPLHVGLQLNADGDSLALYDTDGLTLIDSVTIDDQILDVSYGRYLDGDPDFFYFNVASPGTTNDTQETFAGQVEDTKFSHDRGFYDAPFAVTITTDTPGATIYYTIDDGTDPINPDGTPTSAAIEYTGPVAITTTKSLRAAAVKTGWLPTNIDTQSYIFLDDVILQDGTGLLPYAAWGEYGPDWEMNLSVITSDPDTNTDFDGLIFDVEDALLAAPTLALTMNWDDWFDNNDGIYIDGESDERVCSAELISPDGSEDGFQVNCTVQIAGGSSTSRWKMDKLSMRLKFRPRLDDGTPTGGPGRLSYDLFGDSKIDSFNTVTLDARMNFTWAYGGGSSPEYQRLHAQYTRDQFPGDIHNAMGGYAPHGRPVHLYLNNVYWGLYFIHERPDAAFAESYLGGDKDDYDVIKHDPGFSHVVGYDDDPVAKQIVADNYDDLSTAANLDMSNPGNYLAMLDMLDVDDFIDYMIMNFYIGNQDWSQHNWYASRSRVDPDGLWRYHSWDPEKGLQEIGYSRTTRDDGDGHPTDLHRDLRANDDYKRLFGDHVHKHFFNDGLLTPQGVAPLYQKLLDELDRAIVAEAARWSDNQVIESGITYTRAHWIVERDRLLNDYFPQRTDVVLGQLRDDGMYPGTEAPVFNIAGSYQHGGYVDPGDSLTMDNPNADGIIFYTLDGSDPRFDLISPPAIPGGGDGSLSGVMYAEPPGGWTYFHDMDSDLLTDNWLQDNSNWDGSEIGTGNPGGLSYLTDGDTTYIRIQDPGDPRDYDMDDPSNRKVSLIHFLSNEGVTTAEQDVLFDGVTYSFRARVATGGILDDYHPNGGGGIAPWPDGGYGHYIHNGGNGMFNIHQRNAAADNDDGGQISFSLTTIPDDDYTFTQTGLTTNSENGTSVTGRCDSGEGSGDNIVPIADTTTWHEFWITIEDDPTATGTNKVTVYKDGEIVSGTEFIVTMGNDASGNRDSTIQIGSTTTNASMAFDLDFIAYKLGIHTPVPFDPDFNYPPNVNAGLAQVLFWPADTATMAATVTDDGNPSPPSSFSREWSLDSAPSGVTFGQLTFSPNKFDEDPQVTFPQAGTYVLRLSADDTELVGSDTVTINVIELPPATIEYTGPISLTDSVRVKACVFYNDEWSALNEAVYATESVADSLRITELMYHPTDPTPAEIAAVEPDPVDEDFEFIELQNVGGEVINLNLVHFTDGIDFTVGNYTLAAGEYAVLVKNQDAFAARYGTSGINIVPGSYVGSLDNGGEEIVLRDALGAEIHDFDYKDGWFEITDGIGFSLTIKDPESSDLTLWDAKAGWRPSAAVDGSPGDDDDGDVPELDSIVINEVLAHSHLAAPDWIELHNTTGLPINIGNWYLSDNDNNLTKYKIASGTTILAGEYIVFYENTHFGSASSDPGVNTPFALDEGGEIVYLHSGDGTNITGYSAEENFDASETGVTFGRYEKTELTGGYDFVRQVSPSPDGLNNGPLISDIVITEIYYSPDNGSDYEFVELYNRSGSPVTLEETVTTETSPEGASFILEVVTWRLEGTGYEFPFGVTIDPGEYILVAKVPANYSSAPCDVYGPYDKKLSNGGEEIELRVPGDQEYGESRYWIPIEKIEYDNEAPWPNADDNGKSLHRNNINTYSRDYSNWNAATPTPGS